MAPGKWGTSYSLLLRAPQCAYSRSLQLNMFPDDEDESSGPTSPVVAPVTRRSKFEDEEDDDDVR